jgi:hypothetical protein
MLMTQGGPGMQLNTPDRPVVVDFGSAEKAPFSFGYEEEMNGAPEEVDAAARRDK